MFRLAKWGVIGAFALIAGVYFISSVSGIVVQTRTGNLLPFVSLAVAASLLVWVSENKEIEWKIGALILKVLSGFSAVFFLLTLFLFFAPNIILGIVAALGGLFYLAMLSNPKSFSRMMDSSYAFSGGLGPITPINYERAVHAFKQHVQAYMITPAQTDTIITHLKDRPQLPIAITRFEETDILYIQEKSEVTTRILSLLELAAVSPAPPFLTHIVVALPLIENENGFALSEYRIVDDQTVVERLLTNLPLRTTVIPHQNGPRLIIPEEHIIGMDAKTIPRSHLFRAVVMKNIRGLEPSMEVVHVAD